MRKIFNLILLVLIIDLSFGQSHLSPSSGIHYLKKKAEALLRTYQTTLTADDGRTFVFEYSPIDSSNPDYANAFRIEVKTEDQLMGYVDVYGNSMKRSFNPFADAISVWPAWKEQYRGIGSVLLIFALTISKSCGYEDFKVLEVASPGFFEKFGFKPLGQKAYDGMYFEFNQPLPFGVKILARNLIGQST